MAQIHIFRTSPCRFQFNEKQVSNEMLSYLFYNQFMTL